MRTALGRLLPLVLLLALAVLCGPRAYSALLANWGRIDLLKASSCPPGQFSCPEGSRVYPPLGWEGNLLRLQRAASRLYSSLRWAGPGDQRAVTDLAAALFAQGKRAAAAEALVLAEPQGDPSPLFQDGRYEVDLLRAREAAARGAWAEAVDAGRLGLARGAGRTLPVDERDLFLALAALNRQHAGGLPPSDRALYLTGKDLVRAGEWSEGAAVLRQALDQPPGQTAADSYGEAMGSTERGRGWLLLGVALERSGDLQGARQAYDAALEAQPALAEAAARLLALLRDMGEPFAVVQVESTLLAAGPAYPLGESEQTGQGQAVSKGTVLEDGWTLWGYDLDEEALEAGPPLDLLLWWQSPGAVTPCGQGWLQVGDRWLQWQKVTNLAPNAGFEWGQSEDGLPKGFVREYYGAAAGSLSLRTVERGGKKTSVLAMDNSLSRRVGLVGPTLPVEDAGLYLAAAWEWDDGAGRIGRLCHGLQSGGAYYLPDSGEARLQQWIHYADVNRAWPQGVVQECEMFLTNYESNGTALWDNVLLARIERPVACSVP